jgi:hypothetical protein
LPAAKPSFDRVTAAAAPAGRADPQHLAPRHPVLRCHESRLVEWPGHAKALHQDTIQA